MTVLTTERTAGPFVGDGVQREFPFSIVIWSDEDVVATITTDDVETELSLGSHYTVTVNTDQSATPGGVLRLLSPLPTGSSLFVTTDVSETQLTAITNAGGFFPRVIERALDKLTVLVQQASGLGRRALRVPEKSGLGQLPAAAERAGRVLMFDADGRPVTLALAAIEGLPVAATSRAYTAEGGEVAVTAGVGFRPGSGALEVYCDGLRLSRERGDYTETALGQVVFARPLRAGEEVEFVSKTPAPVSELPSQLAGSDGAGLVGFDEAAPYAPGSIGERLRALYVDDVAALRALPPPSRRCAVHLGGVSAPGDGSGGVMLWNPGSTAADDGDRFIMPDSAPAYGRWERLLGRADLVAYSLAAGSRALDLFRALRRFPAVSDFETVQDAVAHCALVGLPLYWDEPRAVTGNVPGFHSIRHLGTGTLTRSGVTFYPAIRAGQSNVLHVSAAGGDTNDGLTPDFAFRTGAAAMAALANAGPSLDGAWTIRLAAGAYPGGITVPRGMTSRAILTIEGPAVGHPTTPTAVISKTEDATKTYGVYGSDGIQLRLRNLLVSGAFAQGVYVARNAYLNLDNAHIVGASVGLQVTGQSRYFVTGGRIADCTSIGISELFHVTRSFDTVGSAAEQMTIENCPIGLKAKESCVGHLDYLTFIGCQTGAELQLYSGANCGGTVFKTCAVGIVLTNSEIHNESGIVWGTGSDACTRRLLEFGSSCRLESLGWEANSGNPALRHGHRPLLLLASMYNGTTHTGTTAETDILSAAGLLKADVYAARGKKVRALVNGRVPAGTTLAGAVRLLLRFGGTFMADVTIPAGTAGARPFRAEFEVVCTADGPNQLATGLLVMNGASDCTAAAPTLDMSSVDRGVNVAVLLANAADSVQIDTVEIWG